MIKKISLCTVKYLSSLKQLKSSAIHPWSSQGCTDLLITLKHPESQSSCLQLTSQWSWEHSTCVQKHLHLAIFQRSVSVQKPLPTSFHSCGTSGCAEEWPGLSPPATAFCPIFCPFVTPKHTGVAASTGAASRYMQTCLGKFCSYYLADF